MAQESKNEKLELKENLLSKNKNLEKEVSNWREKAKEALINKIGDTLNQKSVDGLLKVDDMLEEE